MILDQDSIGYYITPCMSNLYSGEPFSCPLGISIERVEYRIKCRLSPPVQRKRRNIFKVNMMEETRMVARRDTAVTED